MDLLRRVSNPLELEKLIQQLYIAKNKRSVDFSNLTNLQAKQIANAISNIQGFAIRKYGYNLGNISIPLLINGVEKFNLNDTGNQEVKYYPTSDAPLTITCREDFNPPLNTGEYIRIYTQVDNGLSVDRIFKSIPKDTLIGVYNTGAYFQQSKENFGSDLQVGTPFNIEVVNNTTKSPKLKMYSQYYAEFLSSVTGSTITTQQWQNWNYLYPFWSIDMTNETQGVKFELYHKETNQLLGNGYAYPGGNYSGDNYMGQVGPYYSTNNFKIVISNI